MTVLIAPALFGDDGARNVGSSPKGGSELVTPPLSNAPGVKTRRRRSVRVPVSRPFWRDADGDSYGAGEPKQARTAGELGDGWVTNSTDCNDTNARLFQIATNVGRDMDGDRWLLSGPQSACVGDGPIDVLDLVVFLDENGGGTWLLASTTLGVGDCDDSDQAVHPATAFVPDCDLDQLADDEETVTGCPGTLETVLFHCPNGGTCARRVFVDRGGNFPVYYIPIAQAKHDERGVLLRDPVPGCSSR